MITSNSYNLLYDKCKSLEDKLIKCDQEKMELEEHNKVLLDELQNGCNRCTEDCSLSPMSEEYREQEHQIQILKNSQIILAQEVLDWRKRFNECTQELSEITGEQRFQVIEETIEKIINKSMEEE